LYHKSILKIKRKEKLNKTRKALKIGALYFLTENKEITQKQLLESQFDDIMRSIFTNTNKIQDDLTAENKENAS